MVGTGSRFPVSHPSTTAGSSSCCPAESRKKRTGWLTTGHQSLVSYFATGTVLLGSQCLLAAGYCYSREAHVHYQTSVKAHWSLPLRESFSSVLRAGLLIKKRKGNHFLTKWFTSDTTLLQSLHHVLVCFLFLSLLQFDTSYA